MARTRLTDYLQDHYFWAFDATNEGVPIFNPLFGFSRISAPEISVDVESFKDGTFLYNRSVVKGGSVAPVVFERAASMFDADFYTWITYTLHGNKDFEGSGTLGKAITSKVGFGTGGNTSSPRRNLLVIQFSSININKLGGDSLIATGLRAAGTATIGALTAIIAGGGAAGIAAGAVGAGLGAAGLGGAVPISLGPFQFAMRIPARAWVLNNCLPVRYRAASDFDANSAQVSLMELEVQPESIEEFSLGIKL